MYGKLYTIGHIKSLVIERKVYLTPRVRETVHENPYILVQDVIIVQACCISWCLHHACVRETVYKCPCTATCQLS